jgi:RNA-binding protein
MAHSFTQSLSKAQITHLKSKAHHLNPVVSVGGNGVTETLLKEILVCINHHELIKVSLPEDLSAGDKTDFLTSEFLPALTKISEDSKTTLHGGPILFVARLGRKAIFFREKNPAEAQFLLSKMK